MYKTYGRRLVWYQESLEIMFQAPNDLSTITGSVLTSFWEKVRSRLGFKQDGANRKKIHVWSSSINAVLMQCFYRILTDC